MGFETGTKAGRAPVRVQVDGKDICIVPPKGKPRDHTGVELVLCANPASRAMAFATPAGKHDVQKAHAECQKVLDRYAKKLAKAKGKVNIGPDDDAPTSRFKCGKADLDTRTVEELGLDTCAMLYAGVAYIDSRETGDHARALRAHL